MFARMVCLFAAVMPPLSLFSVWILPSLFSLAFGLFLLLGLRGP